jgi:hypothetical protein
MTLPRVCRAKRAAAGALVGSILVTDADVIRRAREIEQTLSAMTPALLESVGVSPVLTEPFSIWRP